MTKRVSPRHVFVPVNKRFGVPEDRCECGVVRRCNVGGPRYFTPGPNGEMRLGPAGDCPLKRQALDGSKKEVSP